MTTSPRSFIAVAALFLAAGVQAQNKNFYVFLCLGQSNMEGFPGIPPEEKTWSDPRFQVLAAVEFPEQGRTQGQWYTAVPPLCRPNSGLSPADYFGRTLVAKLPAEVRVGVVSVAVAGAKIEVYNPAALEAYAATTAPWLKAIIATYGSDPYRHLVKMARQAQQAGVIRGILLHQGESNVNDPEWPAKVKAIYEHLLKDLDLTAADVPLLAGELVSADQKGSCAGMNATIGALPHTIPTAHVVSSAGCEGRPDHLHFTPAGYRELGKRYAEVMLPLLGVPSVPAK
jgi:Carbohydrate esterase, sialic acid-specific acetylesterase